MNTYYKEKDKEGLVQTFEGKTFLMQKTYPSIIEKGYTFDCILKIVEPLKNYDYMINFRLKSNKNCGHSVFAKLIDYIPM